MLGVFVISGIVITVIFSFFSFGSNAFQKDEALLGLQNEANRVITAITVSYYSEGAFLLEYKDSDGDGREDIVLNGTLISEPNLQYAMAPTTISSNIQPVELELSVIDPSNYSEQITLKTYLRSVKNYGNPNPNP